MFFFHHHSHGGVKALETARALACEQRGALVLVLCVELCSMHKFAPRLSAGAEALKVIVFIIFVFFFKKINN